MINLIFGMLTVLLSTVTFVGEDDGEMLYSIETNDVTHDYVTEQEVIIYITTGKIREDVVEID